MKEKKLLKDVKKILNSLLIAINPKHLIEKGVSIKKGNLRLWDYCIKLKDIGKIYVIGGGKASGEMAFALEKILGDRIEKGFVNVKYGHSVKTKKIIINEAGHPYPDENGVAGVKEIFKILENLKEEDLVIALISGGGSALLPCPVDEISLSDKKITTKLLLNAGADIGELNCVRKHLSKIKGGRLSAAVYPARIISLILSDVIGDKLDVIASGPTYPDSTTFKDALNVIRKYDLCKRIPEKVLLYLESQQNKLNNETYKQNDKVFDNTINIIIGNNALAVNAIANASKELGYKPLILTTSMEGEAKEVGKVIGAIAKEIKKSGNPLKGKSCVIMGGETTVTVKGNGSGGRNQELVLSAAMTISGCDGIMVISFGTDGTDGPTDAAGAMCDGYTLERANRLCLNPVSYLIRNDAYNFFKKVGGLIKTGPTFSNLMDISFILTN